jgi:hypothetical protein
VTSKHVTWGSRNIWKDNINKLVNLLGPSQLHGYARTKAGSHTGFPPLQNVFDLRSGHVTFVTDKMALDRFPTSTSLPLPVIISLSAPHSLFILILIIYIVLIHYQQATEKKKEFLAVQMVYY